MSSFKRLEKIVPYKDIYHATVELIDENARFFTWGLFSEKLLEFPRQEALKQLTIKDILETPEDFDYIWNEVKTTGYFFGYANVKTKKKKVFRAYIAIWRHNEVKLYTIMILNADQMQLIFKEYKILFDSLPDPIFILDNNFTIVKANLATCKALNRDITEIVGKKCYEIVHDDTKPPTNCPHKKLLADHKSHTEAISEKNLGGLNIVTTTPIFSTNGKLIGSIHVTRNIEELRKLREEYEFYFNYSPSINLIVSSDLKIQAVNIMTAQTLNYKKNELIGRDFLSVIHEKDRSMVKDKIEKVLQGDFVFPFITRFVGKKGERILLLSVISPPGEDNKNPRILITGMDVTPLMDLQQKLVSSEKKYETIFNKSKDSIIVLDEQFNIVDINNATEFLFFKKRNEIIGKHISYFLGKDFEKILNGIKNGEEIQDTPYKFPGHDGKNLHLLVSISKFSSFEGTKYFVYLRDVSDLIHYEEKLKENLSKLSLLFDEIVTAMSDLVETRDPYTAGHQRKVANLSVFIGKEMGLSEDKLKALKYAGLTHDIGKIAIPSEILTKPSRLTDLEYEMIKKHPEIGYKILKDIDFPWPVAEIVYEHHERLDGSGYPRGLKDGEILFEARILAVADVVEAMSSHRPYRPALGIEAALKEIKENRGKLYDPDVVDACLSVFKKGKCKLQ